MLWTNTNINSLPFWDSLDKQSHKKRYANYHAIYIAEDVMPSFQMRFKSDILTNLKTVEIYREDNSLYSTITVDESFFIFDGASYLAIREQEVAGQIPYATGRFYFKIGAPHADEFYYSDLFEITKNASQMSKMYWWNLSAVQSSGGAIFPGSSGNRFVFSTLIPCSLSDPEYNFNEIIDTRDDFEFPLVMSSNKTFKTYMKVNEARMDALRLAVISDKIVITSDGVNYDCMKLEISDPEWQDDRTADITLTFTADNITRKISEAQPTQGDFNIDYNEDYFI